MRISVILCTYNRYQSLLKAMESIAASTLPDSVEWEVIVVCNNSDDQTLAVVDDFCRQHPRRFRPLFEPQPGKSYALNTGIRESQGDVLVFTDDDVTMEPQWLQNLTAHLENSEWVGAGGRILPKWTCSPPRWLKLQGPYALAPFVVFDHGPEAGELTDAPFGANMAFRREVFKKFGVFRTDLGRFPDSMIGGEDAEFGDRLLKAGQRLRYEPSAVVYHPVSEDRVQKKYLLAWSFGAGLTEIRTYGILPGTKWFVGGIPLYLFRRLAVWTLRWLAAVEPAQRFAYKLKVWGCAGLIRETYRQSHDAKRVRCSDAM